MHLQSIKIRGFKSFVDPIELKLEPGVAVVVGPNGSGQVERRRRDRLGGRLADAVRAPGREARRRALRRRREPAAADHCEVELVFDNADGGFGDEVDYSEIAITRRLVRGGEGQYLVNKAAVRRTDLVELLADVGLGGSMHSIVSQGKVDAVLASKPEDRRHLVEEAAGLGKFKRRKHRAELKLARVAIQVERAKDVEDEVRKRLRPLALQATAAERAEKLAVEIAALRARIAQLDLAAVGDRRADAEARRDAVVIARRSAQEQLTALLEERQQAEDELSDAAGGRETALGALYRLQGATERLALRRESAAGLEERLRGDLAEAERAAADRSDEAVLRLEDAGRVAAATAARRSRGPRPGGRAGAPRACPRCARTSAGSRRRRVTPRRAAGRARWRRGSARRRDRRPGRRESASRRARCRARATGAAAGVGGSARRDADRASSRRRARSRAAAGSTPAELEALANEADRGGTGSCDGA